VTTCMTWLFMLTWGHHRHHFHNQATGLVKRWLIPFYQCDSRIYPLKPKMLAVENVQTPKVCSNNAASSTQSVRVNRYVLSGTSKGHPLNVLRTLCVRGIRASSRFLHSRASKKNLCRTTCSSESADRSVGRYGSKCFTSK